MARKDGMRPKQLEYTLSSLQREFPAPKIALEQYPTSPQLACSVILAALERGDIGPGRSVIDLGCGTGMLTTACALVDSDVVLGVDCDPDALSIAQVNAQAAEVKYRIDFILDRVKDVSSSKNVSTEKNRGDRNKRGRGGRGRGSTPQTKQLILRDDDGISLQDNMADTVVTNPPFGTKNNAGMDIRFLRTSTRLARRAVYSFHKTSTRKFLLKTVESWGMTAEVIAEMRFDLPSSYQFHKKSSVDVSVDLLRVAVVPREQEIDDDEEEDDINKREQQEDEGSSFELQYLPV